MRDRLKEEALLNNAASMKALMKVNDANEGEAAQVRMQYRRLEKELSALRQHLADATMERNAMEARAVILTMRLRKVYLWLASYITASILVFITWM